MNTPHIPGDQNITSAGTLKPYHFVIIAVVAIGVVALLFWYSRRGPSFTEAPVSGDGVSVVSEGTRAVSLFFADEENQSLLIETRMVAMGREIGDQVRQVVRALLEGSDGDGISTIADGTRVLGVFYDPEAATLYIDFSSELIAGHPGGSSAEYFTISAIMRTISQNFPEVQAVQILVEGLQVGTIAGHIDAYGPLAVSDWR